MNDREELLKVMHVMSEHFKAKIILECGMLLNVKKTTDSHNEKINKVRISSTT